MHTKTMEGLVGARTNMELLNTPDNGCRRIRDDLERCHNIKANDKQELRICRKKNIKSGIKYTNNGCIRQAANPQFIAGHRSIRWY